MKNAITKGVSQKIRTRPRGIIFDFDETLINLNDFVDWKRAINTLRKIYSNYGVRQDLLKRYADNFSLFSDMGTRLSLIFTRRHVNKIQREASKALEKYEVEGARNATLMPGALDALRRLKQRALRIGIVSSNSTLAIKKALLRFQLDSFIDVVVGRLTSHPLKPQPDLVYLCLRRLNCNAKDCILVGDEQADIRAANLAGLKAIGVAGGKNTPEQLRKAGAFRVLSNLRELPAAIQKLD